MKLFNGTFEFEKKTIEIHWIDKWIYKILVLFSKTILVFYKKKNKKRSVSFVQLSLFPTI